MVFHQKHHGRNPKFHPSGQPNSQSVHSVQWAAHQNEENKGEYSERHPSKLHSVQKGFTGLERQRLRFTGSYKDLLFISDEASDATIGVY
jgi:hypothetical protein